MAWQGSAFLGKGWAVFRGASAGNVAHKHPSLQITLSHKEPVAIDSDSAKVTGPAIIVAPNLVHALQPSKEVTLILLEPQTRLARYFSDHLFGDQISLLDQQIASQVRLNGPLQNCLDDIIASLDQTPSPIDARVKQALAILQEAEKQSLIQDIARQVGLSPARLRVIAKQELGVSLSDWVIWRKLERSGHLLAQGSRLADAAFGAGFADQSHFARAMRSHFGLTATMIASAMHESGSQGL